MHSDIFGRSQSMSQLMKLINQSVNEKNIKNQNSKITENKLFTLLKRESEIE